MLYSNFQALLLLDKCHFLNYKKQTQGKAVLHCTLLILWCFESTAAITLSSNNNIASEA